MQYLLFIAAKKGFKFFIIKNSQLKYWHDIFNLKWTSDLFYLLLIPKPLKLYNIVTRAKHYKRKPSPHTIVEVSALSTPNILCQVYKLRKQYYKLYSYLPSVILGSLKTSSGEITSFWRSSCSVTNSERRKDILEFWPFCLKKPVIEKTDSQDK